jgi:hypothetical protein
MNLERTTGKVIAEFGADLPNGLLQNTLEVERRCCPFIEARYEPASSRLTLTIETIDEDPLLDSLFHALSPAGGAQTARKL